MSKTKRIVVAVAVIVLVLSAAFMIKYEMGDRGISLKGAELICESEECPNESYVDKEEDKVHQIVQVYQRSDNTIVVNYNSNFAGFKGKSDSKAISGKYYTVLSDGKITKDDVKIDWKTLMGGQEESKDNEKVMAEITISKDGEVIDNRRVNFMTGAIEDVVDSIEQNKK